MNRIGKKLAEELPVRFETPIAKAVDESGRWWLELDPKAAAMIAPITKPMASMDMLNESPSNRYGPYDIVLWNVPPEQLRHLVPENCNWYASLSSYEMSPCWALLLVLEQRWDLPFDGASVADPVISWMGRESSKPKRTSDFDCWVVHASPEWSRSNLQLDPEVACERLLESVQRSQSIAMPSVIHSTVHRWRYAQPHSIADKRLVGQSTPPNRLSPVVASRCLWDPANRMGACGDWLATGGIEGAMSSGVAMAGRVLRWLTEHGAWVASKSIDPRASGGLKQMELFE